MVVNKDASGLSKQNESFLLEGEQTPKFFKISPASKTKAIKRLPRNFMKYYTITLNINQRHQFVKL